MKFENRELHGRRLYRVQVSGRVRNRNFSMPQENGSRITTIEFDDYCDYCVATNPG